MATKVKASRIVPAWQRSVTFTNSDFVQDDLLDIKESLGRASKEVVITTAAGASITYTLNDRTFLYPMNQNADMRIGYPDLQDPKEFRDTESASYTVGASASVTLTGPIDTLRVNALTVGSGVSIVCK